MDKAVIGDAPTLKLVERILAILDREADGVRRQQVIEILLAGHCIRMGSQYEATLVLDGMSKHAMQMIAQTFR